ncbi:hypothetical protein [Streptomyces pilosus]|uniref:hypothetical protein n=1 Tax=Streptomyces pilosus TaxID=28893 RepID=UPI00363B554A
MTGTRPPREPPRHHITRPAKGGRFDRRVPPRPSPAGLLSLLDCADGPAGQAHAEEAHQVIVATLDSVSGIAYDSAHGAPSWSSATGGRRPDCAPSTMTPSHRQEKPGEP